MTTPIDPIVARAEFPALSRYTYLNSAGAPPMSRRAADHAQAFYREMAAEGDLPWERWLARMEAIRARAAALIHASPAEVAFTSSASHGFTLLAALLGPPAHVVAMRDEYPSATLPFLQYGDEVTFVESAADGVIALDDIEAAITPRTRAVVTSSVIYRTGFRQDLRALGVRCRARGVRLLVDASQSLGAVPHDVGAEGIDALAASGYKWLTAGYSAALLFVRRELLSAASLPVAGWFSARDPDAFVNDRLDLKPTAAVLEVGSPQFGGVFAVGGALELIEEIGTDAIAGRIEQLTAYLHAACDAAALPLASPRDRAHRAGISIVRWDAAADAVTRLAEVGIIVAARGAGIRVSPHFFNSEADLDRLVAALVALRRGAALPAAPPPPQGPLVCVDLNGVLDAYGGWKGAEHWDPPATGAREFLLGLQARGCRTVLFTTRHYVGTWQWLRVHNLASLVTDVTDRKPAADVFLDDHAVTFRGDFADALAQVDAFIPYWAAR